MMKRSQRVHLALPLAGVFCVVTAGVTVGGQDPFGTSPDSGNKPDVAQGLQEYIQGARADIQDQ